MGDDLLPRVFNHSRISTYEKCARQYWYRYVKGLQPTTGAVTSADLGIWIHVGLGMLYARHDINEACEQIKYVARQSPMSNELQLKEVTDAYEYCQRVVTAYAKRDLPRDDFATLQVESSFCVLLGEVCYECGRPYDFGPEVTTCPGCGAATFAHVGRADLIIREDRNVRVMDHKTVRGVDSDSLRNYYHSFQQLGYVYGIRKATGLPVTGYDINFIKRLKTLGTDKQRGEPFIRAKYIVQEDDIQRWVRNRLQKIIAIREQHAKYNSQADIADSFPMTDVCVVLGCSYESLDWGDNNPDQWFNPNSLRMQDFAQAAPDYVDLIREEIQ